MSQTAAPAPQTTPVKAVSEAPVWTCEFFPLEGKEATALNSLTVGARFGWKCHGDIAVAWTEQPLRLVFPKEDAQYSLAILKTVRQDPNNVQYEVTAYKAGDHAPEYVRVLQGEHGFEVAKPQWTVKSVLDPKQKPQPYGSLGPFNLSLPLWFVVAIVLGIVLIVFTITRRLRKASQRRRMLEDLKLHTTALAPLHQFYRDARNLRRRIHQMKDESELKAISEDLDRDFRLFVLRQFQVPALDWSDADILRDVRKRHRKTYEQANEPLRRTLRELSKLKGRTQVGVNDVEQMQRMTLDAAERVEAARERGRP